MRSALVLLSAIVPAELHKLGDRINNELLYLYPAFVPAERFSNSATNTNASPLPVMLFEQSSYFGQTRPTL